MDPMADMDELETLNNEREALGLEPMQSVAEARAWKASLAVADKPADAAPADEVKPPADVVYTAPVAAAPKAVEQAGGREAELALEVQRLKSEAGRSSVLANELKDLKAALEASAQREAEAVAAKEAAEAKASGGGLFAFLTPEQRAEMSEPALDAIERGVTAYVQKAVAAVEAKTGADIADTRNTLTATREREAQREAQAAQARADRMWVDVVQPVIPAQVYGTFISNPKWDEWCAKSYAGNFNANLYNAAVSDGDGEAVIDLLSRFMRYAGIEVPTKGAKPPVRATEIRGGAVAEQPKADDLYQADVERWEDLFFKGKLGSEWTPNKVTAFSQRIDDARREGRIKPGSAPR